MRPSSSSAAFVSHVLTIASQYGVDDGELLQQVGLERAQLVDPIQRIPMRHLRELLRLAGEVSGLPHFGLLVGAAVRPGTYGCLGYAAMTSATMGEAMGMIRRFGKIVFDSPSSQTQISIDNGLVTQQDLRLNELEPYSATFQESVLSGWTAFGRWLVGIDAPLVAVHMRHDALGDCEPYERFFGCPVQFNSDMNALVFPESMLALPVQGADLRTHKSMLLEADLQLGRSYAPYSTIARVRAFLAQVLPNGEASLESTASHLAMSPRTLQRKLATEGESFSHALETVRMELADHYLRSTDASVMDISLMLGYSQASAFSHAFRQFQGMSPADYRKVLAAAD